MARRSLVIRERSFGSDDPLTACSLNNLALLLKDANQLNEAESMCRKCIEIRYVISCFSKAATTMMLRASHNMADTCKHGASSGLGHALLCMFSLHCDIHCTQSNILLGQCTAYVGYG